MPIIDFASPGFLLLALAVPPVILWWWRRRRSALRYPSASLLTFLSAGRARKARLGGALMRGLSLLLIAVALAGPRTDDLQNHIETEGIAIFIVVDVSGSMAEKDYDWQGEPISRLEAAKNVFRLFVEGGNAPGDDDRKFEGRPTDLIGMVTFATRPESVCPLTLSHSVLLRQLDKEQPRSVPGESETNLSDSLAIGLHRLEQSAEARHKVIVLLTDGEHNVVAPPSGWSSPDKAARVAVGLSVPIYTIDAGGSGNTESSESAQTRAAAIDSLREIARISGGRYFAANDTSSLLDACKNIDTWEKDKTMSFLYHRYHDLTRWPGLAAFLLWTLTLGLEATVWRRVP